MTDSAPVPATENAAATLGTWEAAFQPPEYLVAETPHLVELYSEIVTRLRNESRGIPMHTAQEILLERIATKYIFIKYRESTGWAGLGVNAEKEANQQWLDMLKEWNRVLSQGHEQLRDAILRESEQIAIEAVNLVDDAETRQRLRRHFKERFAAIGH